LNPSYELHGSQIIRHATIRLAFFLNITWTYNLHHQAVVDNRSFLPSHFHLVLQSGFTFPMFSKESDDFGELCPEHRDFMTGNGAAFDELSYGTVSEG